MEVERCASFIKPNTFEHVVLNGLAPAHSHKLQCDTLISMKNAIVVET